MYLNDDSNRWQSSECINGISRYPKTDTSLLSEKVTNALSTEVKRKGPQRRKKIDPRDDVQRFAKAVDQPHGFVHTGAGCMLLPVYSACKV